MAIQLAQLALIAVFAWALIGIWTFARGAYMIAGMSFIFLSFSLYLWETRRE